ncbi:putative DNA helicase [Trichonephila clavipes]|nr:putative DNA helicase [Trichonephila clavipes]
MIAGELDDRRDIELHSNSCSQMPLQRIQDTHGSYDSFQYPLLFVRGEDGYDLNNKDVNKATSNDYFAYCMMQRVNEFNTLLRCLHLFQQYIVDMYAKDGLTYVRHKGTPDLFITFTCNQSWLEITVELLPGQVVADRIDLAVRVLQQKVKKMMHVIKDVQAFGKVACFMYSIEWKKRGPLNMHLLVWL